MLESIRFILWVFQANNFKIITCSDSVRVLLSGIWLVVIWGYNSKQAESLTTGEGIQCGVLSYCYKRAFYTNLSKYMRKYINIRYVHVHRLRAFRLRDISSDTWWDIRFVFIWSVWMYQIQRNCLHTRSYKTVHNKIHLLNISRYVLRSLGKFWFYEQSKSFK
jgi:hypothetical protein